MTRSASENRASTASSPSAPDRLTARQAADRLGVKLETLYAYVSRGMLASQREPGGGRVSSFDAEQVASLVRGRKRLQRPGGFEITLATELTSIQQDHVYYRGRETGQLARTRSFEAVAGWLWLGEEQKAPLSHEHFAAPVDALETGRAAVQAIPPASRQPDRIRAIVAAIGPTDAFRYDLEPEAVAASGRSLIAAMVESLPELAPRCERPLELDGGMSITSSIASRLWNRLTPRAATEGVLELLNAALVLGADHGLAASTFAARVAASVHADPYAVVSTGLGTISGSLHGAASAPAFRLLEEIGTASRAVPGVAEVLRRNKRIPGFGHLIYRDWDPRALVLLDLLQRADVDRDRLATAMAVLEVLNRRAPVRPNIDFLLASLAFVTGMDVAAGEAIFAVARTAGWIAHAIEEYRETPLRFRPRAQYVGAPIEDLSS